jgi:serine/threonine protein kinase
MVPPTQREDEEVPAEGPGQAPREGAGRAPSGPDTPTPGQLLAGKYEVEFVLGRGGMGVVVAARHLELGQRVAIKLMLADAASDPIAAERFLREARANVALSSEHVCRVIDVGRLETRAPYLVMECLGGEDMARRLARQGPMPIAVAVDLMLQACDAVAEAHALGIVHRDLKPANLFVTTSRDGAPLVKVLDFGISKTGGGAGDGVQQDLTATGVSMGSPGYMSPEQVRNTKDVDARSDIWALGVILYEILTGVSPFLGETLGATFAKIVTDDPAPIRRHRPDVPAGLAKTIAACLQRNVDARIRSVADLASRLAEFGPAGSVSAADRIRRMSGTRKSRTPSDPNAPRDTPATAAYASAGGEPPSSADPAESRPAWLRSAGQPAAPPRRVAFWSATTLAIVAAGAIGAGWLRSAIRSASLVPPVTVVSGSTATASITPEAPPSTPRADSLGSASAEPPPPGTVAPAVPVAPGLFGSVTLAADAGAAPFVRAAAHPAPPATTLRAVPPRNAAAPGMPSSRSAAVPPDASQAVPAPSGSIDVY